MPENAVRQSLSAFRFVRLLRMIPNSYAGRGRFSQKIKVFEYSQKGVRMMNKTKAEIEQMASFICREKGQYMFNKKEIGIITGLCKDKVAELCENIPAACDSRVKLYFIKDVLNYLYNS